MDNEESCTGDIPYRYTYTAEAGMVCAEEPETCKMTLCQCDR